MYHKPIYEINEKSAVFKRNELKVKNDIIPEILLIIRLDSANPYE
jgi:hypothetical protein